MNSHIDSFTDTETDMTSDVTLQTLAAAGDQPGWRVIDTARNQHFTGELTFQTLPSITVYFDNGVAYHAVRAGDPSLCERLIEVGVVEPAQIERGVIRVGDVENLGRLFDREPSIDRDAVMVVLELATDEVVTRIANTVSGPFTLTAYRHHVSGVHRWFVSPRGSSDHPAQLTPVGEVAQIDGSVTGDLPGLAALTLVDPIHFDEGVQIEWDHPIVGESEGSHSSYDIEDDSLARLFGGVGAPLAAPAPEAESAPLTGTTPTSDAAPEVEPASPDERALDAAPVPVDEAPAAPVSSEVNDDFQIVWPDGSEQHLTDIDISPVDELVVEAAPAGVTVDSPAEADDAAESQATTSILSFDMPSLAFTANDIPDEQQPEEVVDAVRRALEAIEAASDGPARPPSAALGSLSTFQPITPLELDEIDPPSQEGSGRTAVLSDVPTDTDAETSTLESILPAAPTSDVETPVARQTDPAADVAGPAAPVRPAGLGGFAPPTMNDSAEAVYARAAAAGQPLAGPATGVASVVFVDETPDESDDRSSALRRLIGSLRRK